MATTRIHAIRTTPDKALRYIMSDKVEKIESENEIQKDAPHEMFTADGLTYVRYYTINAFQNCDIRSPYDCYKELKDKWQSVRYTNNGSRTKSGKEPLMYHLHQSFAGREVSEELANEIGCKLAREVFNGFTVTISTHGNTNNVHNHFIISAWNSEGRKWNSCLSTTRDIRRVSDRLCKEYSLSTLDKSRDMKVVRYNDELGTPRMFEPSARKSKIIESRKSGGPSFEDIDGDRRVEKNNKAEERKLSNLKTVQRDIDALLPDCRTYDELLCRLRDHGYKIRDRKKNGEWLAHVAFLAPMQDKATRDYKIGDGVYYTRKALTAYIDMMATRHDMRALDTSRNGRDSKIIYHDSYEYGVTDIESIDNDYRRVIIDDGLGAIVARSGAEKKVITDVRVKDAEVKCLVNTEQLARLIAEHSRRKNGSRTYPISTREQQLVSHIQESFRCLRYVEQHGIYSYQQIVEYYSAARAKCDAIILELSKIDKAVAQLKMLLTYLHRVDNVAANVERTQDYTDGIIGDGIADKDVLASLRKAADRFKADAPRGTAALELRVSEYEYRQARNMRAVEGIIGQMSELENCIRTFDRIDTEHGNKNAQIMARFEELSAKDRTDRVELGRKRQDER